MVHWTASPLVASIHVVDPQGVEVVTVIHITPRVILYLYHKHQNKPHYLFLVVKILQTLMTDESLWSNSGQTFK